MGAALIRPSGRRRLRRNLRDADRSKVRLTGQQAFKTLRFINPAPEDGYRHPHAESIECRVSVAASIAPAPSPFHGGMLFRLLRLIDASTLAFAAVCTRLATIDHGPSPEAIAADMTTAFRAFPIFHFNSSLLIQMLKLFYYSASQQVTAIWLTLWVPPRDDNERQVRGKWQAKAAWA
jgi:hypothetical protein